jgi:hypothetical protein
MANQINLRPVVWNLLLYSGDGFSVSIACVNANLPVDMSGSVTAEIRADRLHPSDPPLASFDVSMVDAYLGIVTLSLSGAQTDALVVDGTDKFVGVWDVQWTPAGKEPRTLVQGAVECVADVTH